MTILGLGTARPAGSISQKDAAALAHRWCCRTPRQRRMLAAVYRQSGINTRASVLLGPGNGDGASGAEEDGGAANTQALREFFPPPDRGRRHGPTVGQRMRRYVEEAMPLAVAAARSALDEARFEPTDISQLITVSCTGFSAPGLDIKLIDALGLHRAVGRTMIGFMGCHGAINGLRVAAALAANQGGVPVLLCAVEMCSLHFQYGWDQQKVLANALFADGAAALVGVADRGATTVNNSPIAVDGQDRGQPWRLRSTGSYLIPGSQGDMTWTIGDHGFEMTLSKRVPALIEGQLGPWLSQWLGEQGLRTADIGSWAIHPGGPRIIDSVQRSLNLTDAATEVPRRVLADCGNMSSPTVLFIVDRLRRAAAKTPCVAVAFGPGLVAEAALFDGSS